MKSEVWIIHGNRFLNQKDAYSLMGTKKNSRAPVAFPTKEAWLTKPLDDAWHLACRLVEQDGVPVIAELRILPTEGRKQRHNPEAWTGQFETHPSCPKGGVTSVLLSRIRFSDIWRLADRELQIFRQIGERSLGDPSPTIKNAKRRRRVGDEVLLKYVLPYVAALSRGSKKPVEEVAGELREAPSKVRWRIHMARDPNRDLLTRPTRGQQGVAGGALTEKAKRLLRATKGRRKK